MTPKKKPAARAEAWPAIQGRMPRGCVDWLLDQAAQHGTSLSEELRSAVLSKMHERGDLERYGLELVPPEEDES